ncbi:MAG: iron-sulfur cluster repair di-iron protein [Bacteroidetes bacterium]|nr:iron-sulfur cluster repair di-iron protein [Bacteroidota bacterium]
MQAIHENILDVTAIEPKLKHQTIFQRFDALKSGEELIIHNDHDPKPLYYQMKEELGHSFQWEYLEQGPVWWKVRLAKHHNRYHQQTLGDLVTQNPAYANLFKQFGLDFCCGGQKTLQEACNEMNLDVSIVEKSMENTTQPQRAMNLPYDEWELDFLCDFIVNTHHTYVNKTLPDIYEYAIKVAEVHGNQHPELLSVRQLVDDIHQELFAHMEKEERILFPFIKELVMAQKANQSPNKPDFETIENPIKMMETEHENAGSLLKEIRKITNNYRLPNDACASYSLLFKQLDEFENDLHTHIHLENNILFPKALKLEKKLR